MSLKICSAGGLILVGISLSGLGATFTVTTTSDSGAGSLRQAISDANDTPGPNLIAFNIPGAGVQTIRSYGGLLLVTNPVAIDGTTQPGYAGMPLIVLDGASRPGFQITGGNSTIRALVVMDCGTASVPASGIVLSTNGGNVIAGCFIGCDATGTNSGYQRNNYLHGIQIDNSPNNVIGGTNAADRNIIFGNGGSGVAISGAAASNNLVEGNYVGLNLAGSPGYPNGFTSFNVPNILITNAPSNTIGGLVAGARNAIAGSADGIRLTGLGATGNQIQGNYIGTAPNGSALPGGYKKYYFQGVRIVNAPANTVGGAGSGAGNLISGTSYAITISGTNANANRIQGNFIGTDVSGTSTNDNYLGIYISDGAEGTLIGGTVPGAGNLISANDSEGIFISGSSDNVIQGNFIGTDVTGTAALGNTPPGDLGSGVLIDAYLFPATNNWIGGASAGARNIISGNNDTGIEFGYGPSNNVVQGNFIGTDVTGNKALGNVNDGVLIGGAVGTLIGGTNAGEGNVISANGGNGVDVQSGATGTLLEGNTVGLSFSSAAPAPSPSPAGKPKGGPGSAFTFLPNGQSDFLFNYADGNSSGSLYPLIGNLFGVGSGGPGNTVLNCGGNGIFGGTYVLMDPSGQPIVLVNGNNNQAAPVVTGATYLNGTVTVTGTLTGPANSEMTVQTFVFDPTHNSFELVSTTTNPTDPTGNGNFAVMVPNFTSGFGVAVTVTDPANNTSAFSSVVVPTISTPLPPPGPNSCANHAEEATTGCPISMFTGELFNLFPPDLLPGGPLPVEFTRYYASFLKADGLIAGKLGDNWLHNYEMTLTATTSNTVNIVNNEGRLIPFTNSAGNFVLLGQQDVPFQLAPSGAGYVLGDPRSQMLYMFDSTGKLSTVADGHGNAQTLSYNGNQLASVTDGLGRTLTFQYSGSGFLTNVSDGIRAVGFVQTGNNLTSVIDPLGFVTTYAYDPTNGLSGLLTTIRLPEGNVPVSQTFNANGQVITQTSAGTNVISLTYSNPMTSVLDPLGDVNSYVHSPAGQVVSMVDAQNHSYNLGYNVAGQRTIATNRLGQIHAAHYHAPSGNIDSLTEPDGSVTTFTYTNRLVSGITFYDLARAAYADGTSESFAYDANGNALTHTDRAGKVFSFTYNTRGQTLTCINPLGGVTSHTYDAKGRLVTQTDSEIGITTFQYDPFDHLTNVIHPDGTAVQAFFDVNNRLLSLTDERNNATAYGYDRNNRILSVTNANSKFSRFTYDSYDRMVEVTDRLGHNFACSYNAINRVAAFTNRNGFSTTFREDSQERLTSLSDPAGKTWSLGYDTEARLLVVTDPLGHVTSQGLNQMGFATLYTNALGQTASVARDALQRVTNCVDALNRTNSIAYEPRSQLASAAAPLLGEASFQRDDLGRITAITDLDGQQWRCAYSPMGRLLEVIDPLNRTNRMTYDTLGRPTATIFSDGGTCSNIFDSASNPTRRQYPGGPDLQYTYDNLSRPVTADGLAMAYDAEDRVTNTVSSGINQGAAYDADGHLVNVTYNNGAMTVTYSYDSRNHLIQVNDSLTGAQIIFNYDDSGRLTGTTRANGVNGTYTYDAADRLTRIQEGAVIDLQYTLDPAGQITNANFAAPLDPANFTNPILNNFAYDAAHQIASPGYAYDSRGRQTAAPGHAFSWDGASRLTGMDGLTLGYNGLNDLVTRAAGGVTTRFFYNLAIGMTPPVAEQNDTSGAMQRYYVWSPAGRLLYMIDAAHGNEVYYFHADRIGSTLALTAANGAVTDAYAYSPYGALLGHAGTNTQPFTFVGAFGVRAEGGLYQMRARYYDPSSARFLTRDPLGPDLSDVRTLDPYNYAAENPLSYVDAYGQCSTIASGLIGTGRVALQALAASKQAAAEVAMAKLHTYAGSAGNELLNWYEAYLHGNVWVNEGEEVVQRAAATEEEAALIVNTFFGRTPGNPLAGPRDYDGIFLEENVIARRTHWWQEVQQRSVMLEEEALLLTRKASKLKVAGKVLAAAGIALDTGIAIHEDYNNGAGWLLTLTDANATIGADVLVAAAPIAVGGTDLATGGGVTGLLHNGLIAPNTVGVVGLSLVGVGRLNTRTAVAVEKMYTRASVTRFLWDLGNWLSGGPPIRAANY